MKKRILIRHKLNRRKRMILLRLFPEIIYPPLTFKEMQLLLEEMYDFSSLKDFNIDKESALYKALTKEPSFCGGHISLPFPVSVVVT